MVVQDSDTYFQSLRETLLSGGNVQQILDTFLPMPPKQTNLPPALSFIPADPENLHFLMAARGTLATRITQGWYKNNLIILTTLEKAGSTLSEVMLCEMLIRARGTNAKYFPASGNAGPISFAGSPSFTYMGLLNIPDGGVFRGCFEPTDFNIRLMKSLLCPVVILLRHPIDRLIANMCMRYKQLSSEHAIPLSQVIDAFLHNTSKSNNHLKAGGYLPNYFETLQWMADWIGLAERHAFHIVRYEDIFFDAEKTIKALHREIFKENISQQDCEEMIKLQARTNQGGDLQASKVNPHHDYPRGYTGKRGVWRDYLSRDHVAMCNRITEAFLAIGPHAAALQKFYPDLMLDAGELS